MEDDSVVRFGYNSPEAQILIEKLQEHGVLPSDDFEMRHTLRLLTGGHGDDVQFDIRGKHFVITGLEGMMYKHDRVIAQGMESDAYEGDPTVLGTVLELGIAFTPGAGEVQGAYATEQLAERGEYSQAGLSGAGLIPVVGEGLKGYRRGKTLVRGVARTILSKGAGRQLDDVALEGVEHIDELFGGTSRVVESADEAGEGGFGLLVHAKEYSVLKYRELRKFTKGTGLEAHHLIEKRFADLFGVKP